MLHSEMATFAARHSLSPEQAVVLPALFSNVSKKTGHSERQLVADATFNNPKLGEYLASVAREVAAQVAA